MKPTKEYSVVKLFRDKTITKDDLIAIEEPLEIRVKNNETRTKTVAITMRTPGQDEVLTRGFLFTEGIIPSHEAIDGVSIPEENIIVVSLNREVPIQNLKLDRNFYVSSSCGVCGKASLEAIAMESQFLPWSDKSIWNAQGLYQLPTNVSKFQEVFSKTGGIHAAAIFNQYYEVLKVFEDVGRHNAMDKLVGHYLSSLPLIQMGVFFSGRASFELLQKAYLAGLSLVVSVGAPSSLAIDLAQEAGITLVGFLKNEGFNIYTYPDRIVGIK